MSNWSLVSLYYGDCAIDVSTGTWVGQCELGHERDSVAQANIHQCPKAGWRTSQCVKQPFHNTHQIHKLDNSP